MHHSAGILLFQSFIQPKKRQKTQVTNVVNQSEWRSSFSVTQTKTTLLLPHLRGRLALSQTSRQLSLITTADVIDIHAALSFLNWS